MPLQRSLVSFHSTSTLVSALIAKSSKLTPSSVSSPCMASLFQSEIFVFFLVFQLWVCRVLQQQQPAHLLAVNPLNNRLPCSHKGSLRCYPEFLQGRLAGKTLHECPQQLTRTFSFTYKCQPLRIQCMSRSSFNCISVFLFGDQSLPWSNPG